MDRIFVSIDGIRKEAPKGSRIIDLLPEVPERSYEANPVVAATVNGIARSLSERVEGNAEIMTIRLCSKNGRRVYRKSLCFLLCYASALISPERSLIIGHSLGPWWDKEGLSGITERHPNLMLRDKAFGDDPRPLP